MHLLVDESGRFDDEAFDAASFATSLAATLNISVSLVTVTNVTAGSVIVEARIEMELAADTLLLVELTSPALEVAGFDLLDAPASSAEGSCRGSTFVVSGRGESALNAFRQLVLGRCSDEEAAASLPKLRSRRSPAVRARRSCPSELIQ